MANPPSYEESANQYGHQVHTKTDLKEPERFSIREELGISRAQRVTAVVSQLLPKVRERAKQGLSKSTLVLLPSSQDTKPRGTLVGFPEDDLPILIQLDGGQQDNASFWTQMEALDLLKTQMLGSISESAPIEEPLPARPAPPTQKSSFFGRKQSKDSDSKPPAKVKKARETVDVSLDEVHFRAENEYGLYETLRVRCVLVVVDVR